RLTLASAALLPAASPRRCHACNNLLSVPARVGASHPMPYTPAGVRARHGPGTPISEPILTEDQGVKRRPEPGPRAARRLRGGRRADYAGAAAGGRLRPDVFPRPASPSAPAGGPPPRP